MVLFVAEMSFAPREPKMNFFVAIRSRSLYRPHSDIRDSIFYPKIYIADFWNSKQGFLSVKLIQKSDFRVVLRKIKTRHTLVVKTV